MLPMIKCRVAMSVGIVEFTIDANSDIERILSEADMNLYIEKKAKTKQVYKNAKSIIE